MKENKKSQGLVKKRKSLSDIIQDFFEKIKTEKFYKYARGNNPEDREKALKQWSRLSEENQISFLRYYIILNYKGTGWDVVTGERSYKDHHFPYKIKEFQRILIDDLWKKSSYNVQNGANNNMGELDIPAGVRNDTINTTWFVIERNFKFTAPELQKKTIQELINASELDEDPTFAWIIHLRIGRHGRTETMEYEAKCRIILGMIEDMDSTVLSEMFDSIMQLLGSTHIGYIESENIARKFAEKIPESIKAEKIDTTFDYAVRDDKLFALKWEGLSYAEKIEALGKIFQESIFEKRLEKFKEFKKYEDPSIIRRMYPAYYTVSHDNEELIERAKISYDPKVIKRIIGSLRGDDIEKHVMSIINMKVDNSYTIYYIWSSLDRRIQEKLYDQVMGILEGKPVSQYALWYATRNNSRNQKKKLDIALSKIQTLEDVEKMKSWMRFLLKGISKDEKDVAQQGALLESGSETIGLEEPE